jgi:pimeloyl-ACP methyl ester carboxylesterase
MKHIIFIPGLGSDERLFRYIDLNGSRKQFIKWTTPAKNETLQSYLQKIKEQITVDEPPIIIGVSLGGIIAMELREIIPVEKTIIISSVKTRAEMPAILNLVRYTNLNNIVPLWLARKIAMYKPIIPGNNYISSTTLFEQMINDADDDFLRWGMQAALDWQRKSYEKNNLVHIHGTKDLVFPFRNITNCHYTIKDGSHGMIMSKPGEINEILRKEIFNL